MLDLSIIFECFDDVFFEAPLLAIKGGFSHNTFHILHTFFCLWSHTCFLHIYVSWKLVLSHTAEAWNLVWSWLQWKQRNSDDYKLSLVNMGTLISFWWGTNSVRLIDDGLLWWTLRTPRLTKERRQCRIRIDDSWSLYAFCSESLLDTEVEELKPGATYLGSRFGFELFLICVIINKIVGYHVALSSHNEQEIAWLHCLRHLINVYLRFYSLNYFSFN